MKWVFYTTQLAERLVADLLPLSLSLQTWLKGMDSHALTAASVESNDCIYASVRPIPVMRTADELTKISRGGWLALYPAKGTSEA